MSPDSIPLRLAPALLVLLSLPASAEGVLVDQVEALDIEKGETALEIQFAHAWFDDERQTLLTSTVDYAVSDRVQFGLEIETLAESGTARQIESLALQMKWAIADGDTSPIGLGIQPSVTLDPGTGRLGAANIFIATVSRKQFDWVGNVVMTVGPKTGDDADLSYASALYSPVTESVEVGLEAGGVIAGEDTGHFAGPLVRFTKDEHPQIELAAFFPIAGEAPDFQVRIQTEIAF